MALVYGITSCIHSCFALQHSSGGPPVVAMQRRFATHTATVQSDVHIIYMYKLRQSHVRPLYAQRIHVLHTCTRRSTTHCHVNHQLSFTCEVRYMQLCVYVTSALYKYSSIVESLRQVSMFGPAPPWPGAYLSSLVPCCQRQIVSRSQCATSAVTNHY